MINQRHEAFTVYSNDDCNALKKVSLYMVMFNPQNGIFRAGELKQDRLEEAFFIWNTTKRDKKFEYYIQVAVVYEQIIPFRNCLN